MSTIIDSQVLDGVAIDLYDTATGKFWLPNLPSDVVLQTIINDQVYDEPVVNFVRQSSRLGNTVLDVGSNFGQMAVLYSQHVGDHGHVYAFEAQAWIQQVLQLNLAANGITNCTIVKDAVWDESGRQLTFPKADFVRFESYGSYGVDPSGSSGDPVTTVRIDDIVLDGAVSVMKIDVQGSDLRAMKGARETIVKHQPVILFEYETLFNDEFATSWQDYYEFINSINYYVDTSFGSNHVARPK